MLCKLMNSDALDWAIPKFQNIPLDLIAQPWAVWTAEPRIGQPGKFNKAPRSPKTGFNIASSKPQTFGSFEDAKRAYQTGKYTGVGVLLTDNGIIGVDIDNYPELFKAKPEIKAWAQLAIKHGHYCERSPSKSGLRLFMRGELPGAGRKHEGLEIYQTNRFLTVTGHIVKVSGDQS